MAHLHFVYSTMNAGKSMELIRVAHNYLEHRKHVLVMTSGSFILSLLSFMAILILIFSLSDFGEQSSQYFRLLLFVWKYFPHISHDFSIFTEQSHNWLFYNIYILLSFSASSCAISSGSMSFSIMYQSWSTRGCGIDLSSSSLISRR